MDASDVSAHYLRRGFEYDVGRCGWRRCDEFVGDLVVLRLLSSKHGKTILHEIEAGEALTHKG